MARNHKDCKNIKFYVMDVERRQRVNKETGHVWNKAEQLPICQQGDELVVCRRICKHFK